MLKLIIIGTVCGSIMAATGVAQAKTVSSPDSKQFALSDLVCTVVYHTATKTTTMTCTDEDPLNRIALDPNG